MPKQSGLGNNAYVGGYNLSGDIQGLDNISGPQSPFDMTGIDKSAHERVGGARDGLIGFTSFFNPDPLQEHVALNALPTADQQITYCVGTTVGDPAASMVGKQINYDGNRSASGEFILKVEAQGDGFGLEWGRLLTAGVRTDASATATGTSIDTTASVSLGGQAYLHVFALTGTSVTVKIQDSADNVTFADVTGFTFTAATVLGTQRLQLGPTATLRRYLRVITTGTFTNAQFAVVVVKNTVAVVF